MSTVAHAERYGKPVFAVPGSIFSKNSDGTNRLLRDGRARAVCQAEDLFQTLGLHPNRAAEPAPRKESAPMDDRERKVLACIGIEELSALSGLPTAVLLGVLMKLELSGRVFCQPGKRYILR